MKNKKRNWKGNILIVEDDGVISLDIKKSLKGFGYKVVGVAVSGKEALEKVATAKPDLVIMDIVLKGKMDGIETASKIKALHGIPSVFLTAYADDQKIEKAKAAQPFGYILKPFQSDELRVALEMAMFRLMAEKKMNIKESERREAVETMVKLSARQKSILAAVPDIIMEVDRKMVYTWANRGGIEFFGEDVIGKEISYYFEGGQKTSDIVKPIFSGNEKMIYVESWQRRKDGQRRLLAWRCKTLKDDKGKVIGALSSAQDITDRKKDEEATRASESKFRAVVEHITDVVFTADSQGQVTFITPNVSNFGYTPQDVIGHSFTDFIHPDDVRRIAFEFEMTMKRGVNHPSEFRMKRKDGSYVPVEESDDLIREKGKPVRLVGTFRDITERKTAEDKLLLDSQILENMAEGVNLIRATDSTIVYTNPKFESMFGYSPGELIGKKISVINAPGDKTPNETAKEIISKLKTRGLWSGDLHHIRKDGTTFWCHADVNTFKHPDYGEVWISIHQDITERKKAAAALQDSKDFLDKIINTMSDPVFVKDDQCRFVLVNNAEVKLTGLTREKQMGKTTLESYPKNEADTFLKNDRTVLKTGKESVSEEHLTDQNGKILTIVTKKTRYVDAAGNKFLVGVIRDITERVRSEQQLRESEEQYRVLTESATDQIFLLDKKHRYLSANRALLKLFKKPIDKIVGKPITDFFPKDTVDKIINNIDFVFKFGHPKTNFEEEVQIGGHIFYSNVSLNPIKDSKGRVIAVAGIVRDITKLKMEEEQLLKLKLGFERSTQVMFMTGPDGKIQYVNPAFEKTYGYKADEVIGKTPRVLKSGQQSLQFYKGFWNQLLKGKSFNGEVINKTKKGDLLNIQNSVNPILGPNRNIQGFLAIQTNITDQKITELELTKSYEDLERRVEERTSELAFKNTFLNLEMDNSNNGTLIVDPHGKVLSTNRRFAELWDIPKTLLKTKDDKKLLDFVLSQLKDPDEFVHEVNRLYAHPKEISKVVVEFKDGRVFDRYSAPLISPEGAHFGRLWSFRDMSAEAAIDRAKTEFVSLASHQLRTPLTAIKWLLEELFRKGKLDSDQLDKMLDIQSSTERLIKLVNDLLNVSRLESGAVPLDRQEFAIGPVLDHAVRESKLHAPDVEMTVQVEPTGLAADGDPERVHQVVANLLENAVRHSPEGGAVRVRARRGPRGVRIEVLDDGPGIPDDEVTRVFERFYRSDSARAAKDGGAGLGLAIAQWIVELHGGEIHPERREPHGCRMVVTIPAAARP